MNRIRDLRKEKGLTQSELAKILTVSDRSVGFYENGERDPDTNTLKQLADFFDVSIDYLLGRTNLKELADKNPERSGEDYPAIVFHKNHSCDQDLPPEAKDEIEKFKEYIRYKYRNK